MTECEDCGDKEKRRTRCKRCALLVCGWCLHHVHHAPHTRKQLAEDPSRPEDSRPISGLTSIDKTAGIERGPDGLPARLYL